MVDCVEHLDLIEAALGARARRRSGSASTSTPAGGRCGGRVKVGAQALAAARRRRRRAALARRDRRRGPGSELVGADGLRGPDRRASATAPPGRRLRGRGDPRHAAPLGARAARAPRRDRRRGRARSRELEFVNGGGTGSLELTAAERGGHRGRRRLGLLRARRCSTTTAASRRRPAAVLRAARRAHARRRASRPRSAAATSPPAPPAPDRLPAPVPARRAAARPAGGRRRGADAAARRRPPTALRVGDRVYFRHAKAGELCERFDAPAPGRGRPRSSTRSRPTAARARRSCDQTADGPATSTCQTSHSPAASVPCAHWTAGFVPPWGSRSEKQRGSRDGQSMVRGGCGVAGAAGDGPRRCARRLRGSARRGQARLRLEVPRLHMSAEQRRLAHPLRGEGADDREQQTPIRALGDGDDVQGAARAERRGSQSPTRLVESYGPLIYTRRYKQDITVTTDWFSAQAEWRLQTKYVWDRPAPVRNVTRTFKSPQDIVCNTVLKVGA